MSLLNEYNLNSDDVESISYLTCFRLKFAFILYFMSFIIQKYNKTWENKNNFFLEGINGRCIKTN